ncbi:MAG: hypothetical protein R3D71_07855 [Rickettsiales bacterium]
MSDDENKLEGLRTTGSVARDAGVAGAIGGIVLGTTLHDKVAHEAVEYLKQTDEKGVDKFFKEATNADIAKFRWNSMGRAGKAGIAAIVIGAVTAAVGAVVGLFGGRKARQTQDRFDELSAENQQLKGKMGEIENGMKQMASMASDMSAKTLSKASDKAPSGSVADVAHASANIGKEHAVALA